MADLRLVLFDLDGTLITSYMDNDDKDYHKWVPYPDAAPTIALLRANRIKVGIITNQAGVGFGYTSEAEWEAKRDRACEALGVPPTHVWACFAHPKSKPPYDSPKECLRRKPNAAMLDEAMRFFGCATDETLYVGDMDSDEQAARHARVPFLNDIDFFEHRSREIGGIPEEAVEKIKWTKAP